MEPVLGQSLPLVHLPVLHEIYLTAQHAANLAVLLQAGVDLLHQCQGVCQGVRFEVSPEVSAEVIPAVLLEVDLLLRPEVDREVRHGVVLVVMHGADLGVPQEVGL